MLIILKCMNDIKFSLFRKVKVVVERFKAESFFLSIILAADVRWFLCRQNKIENIKCQA